MNRPPVRLTRRGRIAANIAITLALLPVAALASLDVADAAPPPPVQESVLDARSAKKPEPWKCRDTAAKILYEAGFRGYAHKQAWAITYRESKHQNLDESSPWFTGALGYWQVQTSAHSGKSWWSRSAMLDPLRQSRIVYKHMTNKGRYWAPWGLTAEGNLDASHYGGWSSWQHENWIMAPFRTGLSLYPCKTLPPKEKK